MGLNTVHLSGHDAALFISDIHLCDDEMLTAAHFFDYLLRWAPAHSHIFILGDLFESWCGDDTSNLVSHQFTEISKALLHQGKRLYLVRGNRDFLIDVPTASSCPSLTHQLGATLLADETVMHAFGTPWLLLHGDQLCTLDTDYQAFRLQSRSHDWQHRFLQQPLEVRLNQAAQMRQASKLHQIKITTNEGALYDVVTSSALTLMAHYGVRHLLHGHTHRPAVHVIDKAGDGDALRYVLSDWGANRGDALSLSAQGIKRLNATSVG
jgi:UDP-2,3-diacylglucosamine hydrolase